MLRRLAAPARVAVLARVVGVAADALGVVRGIRAPIPDALGAGHLVALVGLPVAVVVHPVGATDLARERDERRSVPLVRLSVLRAVEVVGAETVVVRPVQTGVGQRTPFPAE